MVYFEVIRLLFSKRAGGILSAAVVPILTASVSGEFSKKLGREGLFFLALKNPTSSQQFDRKRLLCRLWSKSPDQSTYLKEKQLHGQNISTSLHEVPISRLRAVSFFLQI